ncbi:MAG: conserved exported protein of unknown function [Methanothrix sp.]|jgi:serine/threonine-protein kinase|nr:MAG: conserved exported protein of unknown function [Methanothrix sp.]
MSKKVFLFFFLFVACMAASGEECAEPMTDASNIDGHMDVSGALSLSDLGEMLLYENGEHGFSVAYPSSWRAEEPDPNDLGVVVGFLAPDEDIDDPKNYVTVQFEVLPAGLTLEGYTEAILTNLRGSYPDFELLAEADMKISDGPGHVIAYGVTVEGTAYQVLLAYTIRGDKAYIITYYALAESYAQFEDDAKRMINSFTLS